MTDTATPTRLLNPLARLLFILSFLVALAVTLQVVLIIFTEPGDTIAFLFSVLETRFLPSTVVFLLGCWSVAYMRWPPVWLQLLCVPMSVWGIYAMMQFLAEGHDGVRLFG